MEVLMRPVINGLARFVMFGDASTLECADRVARRLMELRLVDDVNEVRTCAQVVNLCAVQAQGEFRPGECGCERVCQMNRVIDSLASLNKLDSSLASCSKVEPKCYAFECRCHPEYLQYTSAPVEVGNYNSPRFLEE